MKKILNKTLIKREVKVIHFIFLLTGKILFGIAIGLIFATKFWYAQPYWYLIILLAAGILIPTLRLLMREEYSKELELMRKRK